MLTPVDIQNKSFKGGIGFDKRDVEAFMNEVSSDYSMLYRSNVELNDKVKTLSESLQHYKSIEDSMQKALTISEKTSEETINAASDKARQITTEAELKAETLLADAKQELEDIKNEIYRLQEQEKLFKEQYRKMLNAQLKLLDGEIIDIDLGPDFEPSKSFNSGKSHDSYSGSEGGLGAEGGLGGGYTGSNPSNFERTAQSPTFDRGSNLGTDPFADAANGGGRFSRQTGGDYTGASKNKSKSAGKGTTSLNIKTSKSNTVHRGSAVAAAAMAAKSGSDPENKKFENTKTLDVKAGQTADSKNSAVSETKKTVEQQVNPKSQPIEEEKPKENKAAPKSAIAQRIEAQKAADEKIKTAVDFNEAKKAAMERNITVIPPKKDTEQTDENNDQKSEQSVSLKTNEEKSYSEEDLIKAKKATDDQIKSAVESIQKVMNKSSEKAVDDTAKDNVNSNIINEYLDNKPHNAKTESDDNELLSGDVESKVNESNMLDSDDNHSDGFDFLSDVEPENEDTDSEEPLTGEVENKVKESNMLDSEDNYSDGFDFLAGNEDDEDDIPTIQAEAAKLKAVMNNINNVDKDDKNSTIQAEAAKLKAVMNSLNNNDDDDVFTGDVEDRVNIKESHMIGNDDDDDDGFSFM